MIKPSLILRSLTGKRDIERLDRKWKYIRHSLTFSKTPLQNITYSLTHHEMYYLLKYCIARLCSS